MLSRGLLGDTATLILYSDPSTKLRSPLEEVGVVRVNLGGSWT